MEENSRKHILSQYTNASGLKPISNPDEFLMQSEGPTMLTENIEMSDPDEFNVLGPTLFTKSAEASDPDEFIMGDPIYLTHVMEESDPDEDQFLFM